MNPQNPSTSMGEGKGRCPFPRAPIPETEILLPRAGSSVEKKSLSTHENTDLFLGMVKLQPGDTSIVEKPGTFPLWYETGSHNLDFSFWKGAESADPEATHGA